jgi:DNA-binding Lrp family transcriptional regulator
VKSVFDATDMLLLQELRRDARTRITTLAKRCSVPSSTVYDRIVRFKKLGVRFTSIVDWSGLGCSLMVCFIVPYSDTLASHPAINNCVRLSANALFVECVFASMLELETFHALIPHAKLYPVVEVLKKEGFVPEPISEPVPL